MQRPSGWILRLINMSKEDGIERTTIRMRFLLLGLTMGFIGLVLHVASA